MRHVETVMGIPMSVDIRDDGDHSAAVRAAFDLLHAADKRFSTYSDESEIAAINRGEVMESEYSSDMRDVLALASQYEQSSGGAFTARVPGHGLDLNGIVKGWAVQAATEVLTNSGVGILCFNAGGDIAVHGTPPGQEHWRVAVRSPWTPDAHVAVLAVVAGAVATSGNYERGAHILDGRTGKSPLHFDSVTVLAESLTVADVLATTVFIMGRAGLSWAQENGADGVLAITTDKTVETAGAVPFSPLPGNPLS